MPFYNVLGRDRHQLLEFSDRRWVKGWIREAYMDCLSFTQNFYQPYYHVTEILADWSLRQNIKIVQDFGSGSGEQVAYVIKAGIKKHKRLPKFILSDLYPQVNVWRILKNELGEKVDFNDKPLSFLEIPTDTIKYQSIFTSFHHLSKMNAQIFLKEFCARGNGLCIVELSSFRWLDLIVMIFSLPTHLIVPFFARSFTWKKCLFTTFIPIIPFMVWYDGIISILRAYTKKEIIDMLPPRATEAFNIEFREVFWRFIPLTTTILLITKKE